MDGGLLATARAERRWFLNAANGTWMSSQMTPACPVRGSLAWGLRLISARQPSAAQLIDLATSNVLAVQTDLDPQASFGADVMSRIQAALSGTDLTMMVRYTLGQIIARLVSDRHQEIIEVVLVGNTVMHHLFSGLNVEPLSHVPFRSPHLEAQHFRPQDLRWALPADCHIRFERCLGGFVGSDIFAGILAVGMTRIEDLIALVDLGTNGEIAIGNCNRIVCASTAAGPAFEAASIRLGMRAVTGAISHITLQHGEICVTVIGDVPPKVICGSGLVDAVAVGLGLEKSVLRDALLIGPSGLQSWIPSFFSNLMFANSSWPRERSPQDSGY